MPNASHTSPGSIACSCRHWAAHSACYLIQDKHNAMALFMGTFTIRRNCDHRDMAIVIQPPSTTVKLSPSRIEYYVHMPPKCPGKSSVQHTTRTVLLCWAAVSSIKSCSTQQLKPTTPATVTLTENAALAATCCVNNWHQVVACSCLSRCLELCLCALRGLEGAGNTTDHHNKHR